MQIKVYRNRSVIESFNIDDGAVLTQRLFGENYITVNHRTRNVIDLAIGDYVVHNGIRYYLNTLPDITKESTNHYAYEIVFESQYYNLAKAQYMFDGEGEFDLVNDLDGFIGLMITNLNRVDGAGTWVKGTCDQTNTEYKHLHFNNENCRQVVQRFCSEFDGELYFNRNDINFSDSLSRSSGVTLEYASGLRGITRKTISSKNICTRLYAFGSDRNIASDYGTARLGMTDTKNFVTDGNFETGTLSSWPQWGTPLSRWLNNTMPGSVDDAGTYSYYHKSGVVSPENSGSQQASITVLANTQYTLSAWIWVTSTYDGRDGIRVMTYDGTDYHKAMVDKNKTREWQKISVTFATAAGQTSLTIWAGGKGEAYFDHIQLERGANDTAFVNGTVNYIENNEDLYGTIEHTESFDVYPHRNGTISGVDGADETILYDTGIDFDLDSYLLPGVSPKIHFQTGNLAGYAFDIYEYDVSTDKITIIKIELPDGNTLPDDTVKPVIGDEYTIIDIKMPPSYIEAAEEALFTLAEAWLTDNSSPRVEYDLVSDPRYFRTNGILLNVGDEVTITDTDLGVNKAVRVIELTRKLADQYDYSLKLSESTEGSISQRLYDDAEKLKNQAAINRAEDIVRVRRSWRDSEALKNLVFDPDGLYYTPKIKPLSIETTLLTVGSKSQQFALKEVQIKPNYGGDEDAITITAGTLVHLAVDNDDHDTIGTWTINENVTYLAGGLVTTTAYYLYARCHKTNYAHANNTILLSSTAYTVDQNDYWYFMVGVLHSSTVGVARGISLTYGQTMINGKFITTGKIQSANGLTYFDLDNNTLVIGSASGYSNISDAPSDLTDLDGAAASKLALIEDNATAGATWGSDVASIPAPLANADDTPTVTGVCITPNYIGFWDNGAGNFPVRIKNNGGVGEFFFGSATEYMTYTPGALSLVGSDIISSSGSTQRIHIDSTNNRLSLFDSSNKEVVRIDDDYSPVSTVPVMIVGNSTGGVVLAAENIFETPDTITCYSSMPAGRIQIVNDKASPGYALMQSQHDGTGDASLAGWYDGATLVGEIQVASGQGSLLIKDKVAGYSGGYRALSLDGSSVTLDISGTTKATLNSSGNLVMSTGNMDSKTGFYYNGTKVVGSQGSTISDPSGGSTIDTECRSAVNTIIDRLQAHGLIA